MTASLKRAALLGIAVAMAELPVFHEMRPWEVEQAKTPKPGKRAKVKAARKQNMKRLRQ